MDQPRDETAGLVGRFIVDLGGERRTGLSAQAVADLLAGPYGTNAVIYRIHRVDQAGRMELVGISPRLFQTDDGLIFRRREAVAARADFEALCAAAIDAPPPCRIRLQLVEISSPAMPNGVVLVFPAPCSESVGNWLQRCRLRPGDDAEGGVQALQTHLAAGSRVLDEAVLEALP